MIVAAIGSAYQAHTQYETQKNQAKAEEDNAEYAAEAAANKDEQEKLDRREERKEQRKEQRRKHALMEAAYAKSGVLLDGTPSNYLVAQAETDQLNISRADQVSQTERRNILYQGQLQANEHMNRARAYESAARSTMIGGVVASASSFSSWGGSGLSDAAVGVESGPGPSSSTSGGGTGGAGASGGY